MFVIVEFSSQNPIKKIVGTVNSPDDLLEFVNNRYPLDNILEKSVSDIKKDFECRDGRYFIINGDKTNVKLIYKATTIDRGYIYNARNSEVSVSKEWEIFEIEENMENDAIIPKNK